MGGGIGRGRGLGRPDDKMDEENDKKKEHPPTTIFRVDPGRSFGKVVGQNPGRPADAEMLKKVQGSQVARRVPAPPPPEEEKKDFPEVGSDDLTSDSTSSSFSSGPEEMTKDKSKGSRVSSEGDSEVDELKVHLRKKRQSQRNLERMRREEIWRFRQPAKEIGSDSSDEEEAGEDLKRKWKLREELLQMMREKMKGKII